MYLYNLWKNVSVVSDKPTSDDCTFKSAAARDEN